MRTSTVTPAIYDNVKNKILRTPHVVFDICV